MVSAEKNPLTSSRLPAARGKVKKDNRGDKYLECMLAALKAVANGCDNPEDLFAELDANGHDTSQLGKNAPVKRTPAHVRGKLSEATLAWLSQNGQDLVAIDKIDRDACNAAAKDAKDKDNKSVLADVRLFLHHHELEILSEDEEDELIMTKSRAHTQQRTQRRKDAQKESYFQSMLRRVNAYKELGIDFDAPEFNPALLGSRPEKLKERIEILRQRGFVDVEKLLKTAPAVFATTMIESGKLDSVLEYFQKKGFEVAAIGMQFWCVSLDYENRIKPRFEAMEALGQKLTLWPLRLKDEDFNAYLNRKRDEKEKKETVQERREAASLAALQAAAAEGLPLIASDNKSGKRGVYRKPNGVQAMCEGTNLGFHFTEEDAALAYNRHVEAEKATIDDRAMLEVTQLDLVLTKSNNAKSGYRGVYGPRKESNKKPWEAIIKVDGKNKSLGYFETALSAAVAYAKAEIKQRPPPPLPPASGEEGQKFLDQARKEGLPLVTSSASITGYLGVSKRPGCINNAYSATLGRSEKERVLGNYRTPEEAAITLARHHAQERNELIEKQSKLCAHVVKEAMERNARRPKPTRKRSRSAEGEDKPRAKNKPVQPFYDKELTRPAHEAFPMMKDAAKWAGLNGQTTIGRSCEERKVAGRHPVTQDPVFWKRLDPVVTQRPAPTTERISRMNKERLTSVLKGQGQHDEGMTVRKMREFLKQSLEKTPDLSSRFRR